MENIMFQLFGQVLREESQKEIVDLDKDVLENIFKLSKKHDLAQLVAEGLDRNGLLKTDEVSQAFSQQKFVAVYRYIQIQYEFERICKELEDSKIEYVPLKGAVLRDCYPEPWMRTSSDIDILVKEETLNRAVEVLQQRLEYIYESRNSHDVQLWTPSGVHLELHYTLIEESINPSSFVVLDEVWEDASLFENWCFRYENSDEFFYFYHVAHMAKHILNGGCGIRPFMDLWILNHRKKYSKDKRTALLLKGNLNTFAQVCEALADVWFSSVAHTEMTQKLEFYILSGGVYGNAENKNLVRRGRWGNKLNFWRYRLFLPYEDLCYKYPRLVNHKWMYPYYTVKRWITRLFQGRARGALMETKMVMKLPTEKIAFTKNLIRDLGLSE